MTNVLHHNTIQNCTNLRKSWIEIPKSNPIILRILSGNKGVKTVLETMLRSAIASESIHESCMMILAKLVCFLGFLVRYLARDRSDWEPPEGNLPQTRVYHADPLTEEFQVFWVHSDG